MRRGEVAGLQWTDVDLDAGRLEVRTELIQMGYKVAEDRPKTEASDAPVPLDKATVTLLRAWRKQQAAEQLAAGEAWVPCGRVFTRQDGAEYHPQWITKRFERLAFYAGVPPIRLHDTRHGAACLAHASGASMKAIQSLLRHASYAITADTYTTVFAELGEARWKTSRRRCLDVVR